MSVSRLVRLMSLPLYKVVGLDYLFWAWQYAFQRHTPGSPVYYREREKHVRAICGQVEGPETPLGDLLVNAVYANFDERLVEYPFVRSRTKPGHRVLDVGCTMNTRFQIGWLKKQFAEVHFFNITYEHLLASGNISMIVGDIRETFLPSNYYDEIICISTLEHVGKNNEPYLAGQTSGEIESGRSNDDSWLLAVREMLRLCRPGGLVLVTVPYGIAEDFAWFHVFDQDKLLRLEAVAEPDASVHAWYFKATSSGWVQIRAGDPVGSAYGAVFPSGASAVACLEILKVT